MYIFDSHNFKLLEILLFDAEFNINDLIIEKNKINLQIYRPDCERKRIRKYFFKTYTFVKGIYSTLEIENVLNINIKRKNQSIFENSNVIFSIEYFAINDCVFIETEYVNIEILLQKELSVKLNDIRKSDKNFLKILGKKSLDMNNWLTDYEFTREN